MVSRLPRAVGARVLLRLALPPALATARLGLRAGFAAAGVTAAAAGALQHRRLRAASSGSPPETAATAAVAELQRGAAEPAGHTDVDVGEATPVVASPVERLVHGAEAWFRTVQVFSLALVFYLDVVVTRGRAARVKRRLGLDEADPASDLAPEVEELWHRAHLRNADLLYNSIVALRGVWVKAGQFLSSRPDIVPLEYVRKLAGLQDQIPARPWAEVQATLAEELGEAWEERFRSVDRAALSTASIAQVHRAELRDGTPVALKVMHRGIQEKMLGDLKNLTFLAELLAAREPDYDFTKIAYEWTPAVREELDLRNEASNLRAVGTNLRARGVEVIVPRPFPEFTTEKVLVMEFCEGFSVKATERLAPDFDRALFMRRVCEAFAQQIHVDGLYNADPHPGNILVSTDPANPDSSVPVLLDFGLVKRFTPAMKVAFSKSVHASFIQDIDMLAKSFVDMGFLINDEHKDPLRDMVNMRRLFSPVPQSQVRERRLQRQQEQKAKRDAEAERERERERAEARAKTSKPVEAWPSELVFFLRVTGLLKGLCSSFDIEFPYLQVMDSAAVGTVRNAHDPATHAKEFVFRAAGADRPLVERLVEQLEATPGVTGIQVQVLRGSGGAEPEVDICAGTLSGSDPRPVRPDTLFNVFSVGKAMLAAAAHLLVERGELDLEAPVGQYWADFAQGGKAGITVRQVLGHEGGLAAVMPVGGGFTDLLDFENMTRHVAGAAADEAAVGTFKYHAISYAWIVGGLIESVTGRPLAEFLREELYAPLGLEDSVYIGTGVPTAVIDAGVRLASITNPASRRDGGGKAEDSQDQLFMNPTIFNMDSVREAVLPSANGHATAQGVARFYAALFGESESILTSATKAKILAQQKSVYGDALENTSFDRSHSLGFQVYQFEDAAGKRVAALGHAGLGGSCGFTIATEGGPVAVAITVNELSQEISMKLVRTIAAHYGLRPVSGAAAAV